MGGTCALNLRNCYNALLQSNEMYSSVKLVISLFKPYTIHKQGATLTGLGGVKLETLYAHMLKLHNWLDVMHLNSSQ